MFKSSKRKVALAGGLCAALGLVVSACGSDGGSSDSQTLTIGWNSLDRPGIEAAVAGFEKANPGVEVKLTSADVADYQALIRTQLSSGTAPDAFYVWPGNGNPGAIELLAPEGYLRDLSDRPWVGEIPESISGRTQVDDTTYFAPMAMNGIGAIYNMDLMDELGLTPPTTWDEVLDYCHAATDAGKIPYDVGVADIFAIMIPYALVATNVYTDTPDFDADQAAGKTSFSESEGYLRSLEQELEMLDNDCFGDSPEGTVLADTVTHIADESALAVINITTTLGQFTDAAPDTTLQFFRLPATDDASETRVSGSSGSGPAVNAEPDNEELALKLVDYMGSEEGQAAYASGSKQVPPMGGTAYEAPEMVAEVLKAHEEGTTSPLLDQNWPNAKVQEALVAGVQKMIVGEWTPAQVLESMDAAYAGEWDCPRDPQGSGVGPQREPQVRFPEGRP